MIRALVVSASLAIALAGCTGKNAVDQTSGGVNRAIIGSGTTETLVSEADRRSAPAITGTDLDGKALSLAEFHGKVIVLNVWASWCAPCKAESPYLEKAAQDLAGLGVQFIGDQVKDSAANGRSHVRRYKVTYPSFADPAAEIPARFRDLPPTAIPSTLIIDRLGRVAARFPRPVEYGELVTAVRKIAAETA